MTNIEQAKSLRNAGACVVLADNQGADAVRTYLKQYVPTRFIVKLGKL